VKPSIRRSSHSLRPSNGTDGFECDRLEPRQLFAAVDLIVRLNPDTPPVFPAVMVPGEDLPAVSYQIRRIGAAEVRSVRLQLAASADAVWSADDTVFLDVPITVGIDASASSTRWFDKTLSFERISASLKPGRYTFLIRVTHEGDTNTDPRPANNTRVIKADQRIIWAFGTVGGRFVEMRLTDSDGTVGQFTLSDGTARVRATPSGLVVRTFNTSADAFLQIRGEDFGPFHGDDGRIGLSRVVSSGTIGTVSISSALVTDRVLIERDADEISLRSCTFPLPGGGVFFTMAAGGRPNVSVFGETPRLLISSARAIDTVIFTGGDARAISVSAPSVLKLQASKDLRLHRIRLDPTFGRIDEINVAGRLSSTGLVSIARGPRSLTARWISLFQAQFGTAVEQITTTGPADQLGVDRTTIAAPSFGRIEVPGEISSSTFAAGGTFRVRDGEFPELELTGPGSFGTVIVGEGDRTFLGRSRFLAGISGLYFGAPSTFRTFGPGASSSIGSFTIARGGSNLAFVIAARTIGQVTIGTSTVPNPSTNPNFTLVRDP
jgi:hypothetical protein